MKNRKKQKKKEEVTATGESNWKMPKQPGSWPGPHDFNPYPQPWFRLDEKWICDTCGYEEDMRSRGSFRFQVLNSELDTGDLCPNCIGKFLIENIPQLRKVEDTNE